MLWLPIDSVFEVDSAISWPDLELGKAVQVLLRLLQQHVLDPRSPISCGALRADGDEAVVDVTKSMEKGCAYPTIWIVLGG